MDDVSTWFQYFLFVPLLDGSGGSSRQQQRGDLTKEQKYYEEARRGGSVGAKVVSKVCVFSCPRNT